VKIHSEAKRYDRRLQQEPREILAVGRKGMSHAQAKNNSDGQCNGRGDEAASRNDEPGKEERFSKVSTIVSKATDGSMQVRLDALPEMPDYLKQVIEENR